MPEDTSWRNNLRDALPKARRENEDEKREVEEHFDHLKTRLRNDSGSVTDVEILEQIQELFWHRGTEPYDENYDPLIQCLSFTRDELHTHDSETLKRAWTDFLRRAFGHETTWEWPCSFGLARWYQFHDKPTHAIAVYEHIYRQIRKMELVEYEDTYEQCLLQLLKVCMEKGLVPRARHVAALMEDYYGDGLIGPSTFANVLAIQSALKYREFGEVIEQDRHEAEKSLRRDLGPLFKVLHDTTRSLIIDAEMWSNIRLRRLEPTAGPRRWALAIESGFHYKVFQPNRQKLEPALGPGHSERRLMPGQSCSVGQIARLIKALKKSMTLGEKCPLEVFAKLRWGPDFWDEITPELLQVLVDARHQMSHMTERGLYTGERCDKFIRVIRDSGWVFRFLDAVQPKLPSTA
jgi:hypothetical protein